MTILRVTYHNPDTNRTGVVKMTDSDFTAPLDYLSNRDLIDYCLVNFERIHPEYEIQGVSIIAR